MSLLGGLLAGTAVLSTSTGCSTLNGVSRKLQNCDCVDDFMIGYRNHALAVQRWHEQKHCFENQPHLKHFADGYIAGYEAVAAGSDGCTPTIAPEAYWGWRYQSPEGQAKVAAWFAGYPQGAKAAEVDGLGNWSEIPTMFRQTTPLPPHLASGVATPPEPVQPPTGVPVHVLPEGSGLAPTPAIPLEDYQPSNGETEGVDPFTDELPIDDVAPGPDGTSAAAPSQPFYLPR
ncbi:hypothetical protein [Roseimaritima ulvae]|uniref:hypothetical protein n=1 Tax=Roseimaritima ulvae TaxID=980254 RepID=UPI0008357789|nr:hypothetical protein [Roseimaritima ulvae]